MIQPVYLNKDQTKVGFIDQTQLPNREIRIETDDAEECWQAIKTLQVRGAPAIGVFAAYALYVIMRRYDLTGNEYLEEAKRQAAYLNSSRPTAVNLSWALKRMLKACENAADMKDAMLEEACAIERENYEMTVKIAEYGLAVLKDGDGVLTHCNAGPLACMGYGTALAPLLLGKEKGMNFHVYADETRPLLQGARLTSYELAKAGIDVTLICDNMASIVMKQGKIDAVFVGCDRIAANGDFANKIGTSGAAVLAQYYHVPFYTLGPSSTIDMDTKCGEDIVIEHRDPAEIRELWYAEPMALKEVSCYNPSFDVTDHSLLTGIITEKGIVYPPFEENLKKLFAE